MAFDPQKYLASKAAEPPTASVAKGFDPQLYLQNVGGNIITSDVPTVAGQIPNPPVVEPKRTMMDRVKALYEVPLTAASAAVAGPVSSAYGVYKSATSPQFGTQQGVQVGQQAQSDLARRMTYTPTSPVAQEFLQDVGQVAEAAKLPPVIPTTGMLPSYARMVQATPPQVRQMGQTVQEVGPKIAQVLRQPEPKPTMSGVGSAATPEAVTRTQMAQQLRVPVSLSKGQAERDLGQQQFEIETAKSLPDTVGKPLIEAQAKRNDAILQNFDVYLDETGKQTFGIVPTGKVVTDALSKQAKDAKKLYKDAYKVAKDAGQTNELIDVSDVVRYVNSLEAEEINAPIIQSARVKLNNLAKENKISINDLEEVRKMINRLTGIEPQNQYFGRQIKDKIDGVTEGKGGDLYQKARQLRMNYSRQFENVGAIDKLLRMKTPSDRLIAFEDVFQKSIINGSLDDVKNLGFALKKGGPQGQQAFKELQGQTIEYLKDKVTQSIDTDMFGNPVVSPAKFKTALRELDQDGKLDYLFGKKGAQELRDLLDVTIMVNAPLKGAANYSNTTSAFIRALDNYGSGILGKLPFGVGQIADYSFSKLKERELAKKVKESINYSPTKMAEELKKGSKK